MKLCRHCEWSEDCICFVCEEGLTVICSLKLKHVEKDDCCELFDERKMKNE